MNKSGTHYFYFKTPNKEVQRSDLIWRWGIWSICREN